MIIIYVLVVGTAIGFIPKLFKLSSKLFVNIVVGIFGALIGAFLGFGDNPYPYIFNPLTMSIAVSGVFVFLAVFISKKFSKNK